MTTYLDSSVVLRIVLREPRALREWRAVRRGVASALVEAGEDLVMATHDAALATAARASGLLVVGGPHTSSRNSS